MASKDGAGADPNAAAAGGRGEPPRNYMPSKRLQQTQAQVDEVVDIMRVNVEKVLERDQKLSELDNRAEALQVGASRFEQSAGKLKNKFWWQNMKMWLILGGVLIVLVIILIVWFMTGQKNEGQGAVQPAAPPAGQVNPQSFSNPESNPGAFDSGSDFGNDGGAGVPADAGDSGSPTEGGAGVDDGTNKL